MLFILMGILVKFNLNKLYLMSLNPAVEPLPSSVSLRLLWHFSQPKSPGAPFLSFLLDGQSSSACLVQEQLYPYALQRSFLSQVAATYSHASLRSSTWLASIRRLATLASQLALQLSASQLLFGTAPTCQVDPSKWHGGFESHHPLIPIVSLGVNSASFGSFWLALHAMRQLTHVRFYAG